MGLIMMPHWGDGVEHHKEHEAHDEDAEQLQIVITDEAPDAHLVQWAALIFHHQTKATEEEKYGHTIVAKEG